MMSCVDQYMWIHTKSGFERIFYVKLDQAPYYIGNNKFEILNFHPSESELNTLTGNRDNCNLTLILVDDEEYLKNEYPEMYELKQKYLIELVYLEINTKSTSNDLYIIGSIEEVEKINNEKKKKSSKCVLM
jgi:hypothetical protein